MSRRSGEARFSRRAVLGIAATSAVTPFGAALGQESAAATRFHAVAVDARPLAAVGGGASAALIQRLLPAKLSEAFADLLIAGDARAPTLLARIDRIYLSSYADAPSPGFGSLGSMDSLEGAGIVLAGRQPVSTTPLRVTLPAGYSGAYYLPDIDARRIDSLCVQFASWLRREMNL